MANKKAQHEIVGFILIVVIVVMIGLFLLVFYLRQPAAESKSLNAQNFLQAGMSYTTECSLSIEPLSLEEIIKSCMENRICSNGKTACEVLNETYSEIIKESWTINPEGPENAYSLNAYYEEKSDEEGGASTKQEILSLQEGSCSGSKTGAEYFSHYGSGNIVANIEICYV